MSHSNIPLLKCFTVRHIYPKSPTGNLHMHR